MRLLLVNGNTTEAITALIEREARRAASPGTEIVAVTAPFGPRYIAHRAEAAVAGHAVLQALEENAPGCDAAVVACFGEPGLLAARERLNIPVVGMAEAAMLTACMLGERFSIVTGGARWIPMLKELARAYGLQRRLASVRAHALTGADIARDQKSAAAALAALARAAVDEDGAETVILGGAGLAGLAPLLAPDVPVPLLDGLDCAVRQAELLARLRPPARVRLIIPSRELLPQYEAALAAGWSPNNTRDVSAEQLVALHADPDEFLRDLTRQEGAVTLGDGTIVPRLPFHLFWISDGEFCGTIGFRFQRGTKALPRYCEGHIGYAVVPSKRGRGYATQALRMILPVARREGFSRVLVTTDADNLPSRRVIETNGGVPTPHDQPGKLAYWVPTS